MHGIHFNLIYSRNILILNGNIILKLAIAKHIFSFVQEKTHSVDMAFNSDPPPPSFSVGMQMQAVNRNAILDVSQFIVHCYLRWDCVNFGILITIYRKGTLESFCLKTKSIQKLNPIRGSNLYSSSYGPLLLRWSRTFTGGTYVLEG